MPRIRVLVVDDSVVIRKILSDELAEIPQLNPDLVALDIEMPEMDGLETLKAIREAYPKPPVITFSTLTDRGGVATLDALSLGANDCVTKPANGRKVTEVRQAIRAQLTEKIKGLYPAKVPAADGHPRSGIVAIGVATRNGANALAEVVTWMGQDGLVGCELMAEPGAIVYGQDEQSSVEWGMPKYVVDAGLAHRVIPLDRVAGESSRRVLEGRAAKRVPVQK